MRLDIASKAVERGEGGIRTHETLIAFSGFQDRRIQPLCHLSKSPQVPMAIEFFA
jgi:hypothetical protein